jgi:hypothetical protein
MHNRKRGAIATLLIAALALMIAITASFGSEDEATDESVKVSETPGTGVKTLTFTEDAMDRLGIKTGTVREVMIANGGAGAAKPHKAVPHSAVTYDAEGNTWIYRNPAPDTFVRERVTIEFMDADSMYLSAGPAVGDKIATTGVQEMVGAEFGVGEGE